MPTATKTKASMASSKRKAETIKEASTKGSKKPKIDGTRSKVKAPEPRKPIFNKAKFPIQEDSSEEEYNGLNDDDGVELNEAEDSGESTDKLEQNSHEGIHPDRVKAAANGAGPNGTSSREAHVKQKQLIAERKANKPLAEQLARTKKLWERLRRKSHVPLEERKKLVAELFEIITGKIKDYVLKHDSVRVVQTAIKYANLEQKRSIARELKGTYLQLAQSRYAKFLIGKLLVHGDDEIRDIIVPEFFGNIRRLIKHPEASWILDDVYRGVATGQQKATFLREWYGAEFALFQKENKEKVSGELADILAEDAGKRAPIMRSLQELINHLIQKKTTAFTILHDAMLQYFLNCKPGSEEITDFIELLKGDEEGDLFKNLAFTKSGARLVCLALAYGTAKDRKLILKMYKDTFQLIAADPNAHIVILIAYEVIDDTVLTAKSIFPELFSKDAAKQVDNVVFLANNLITRTTLLYLFQGRSRALFPASIASDLAILAEVDNIRSTTSKKDPEIRRQELAKALSPYLLTAITSAALRFARTAFGCQFITEVIFHAEGDKSATLQAIALTAAGDPTFSPTSIPESQPQIETETTTEEIFKIHAQPSTSSDPSGDLHPSQTPWAGKMLKALISGGPYVSTLKKVVPVLPPLHFAERLYAVIKEHLVAWATGSSSFVVLSLLETEDFGEEQREGLGSLLRAEKWVLRAVAVGEGDGSGDMEGKKDGKKMKDGRENGKQDEEKVRKGVKKGGKERAPPIGNQGTKMIMKLLDLDLD